MADEIYTPDDGWFRVVDHIYRTETVHSLLSGGVTAASDVVFQWVCGPVSGDLRPEYDEGCFIDAASGRLQLSPLPRLAFRDDGKFDITFLSGDSIEFNFRMVLAWWCAASRSWLERLHSRAFQLWGYNVAVGRFTPIAFEVLHEALGAFNESYLGNRPQNGKALALACVLKNNRLTIPGGISYTTLRVSDPTLRDRVTAEATAAPLPYVGTSEVARLIALGTPKKPSKKYGCGPVDCFLRAVAIERGSSGVDARRYAQAVWMAEHPDDPMEKEIAEGWPLRSNAGAAAKQTMYRALEQPEVFRPRANAEEGQV